MPANPDNPSRFVFFSSLKGRFSCLSKRPCVQIKTHLRLRSNVLAFQVKRTCVSSQTHLRFRLNALAIGQSQTLSCLLQPWSCIDLSVKTARMKASTNMRTRILSSMRFVSSAAVLLPMTRPPLVSHNLESTVSLQLNCVWLPSTVMRPMTGTVPSFFTT